MVQSVQWFTLCKQTDRFIGVQPPMNPWCGTDPRKTIAGFMAPVYIHICHPQTEGCSAVNSAFFNLVQGGARGLSQNHVKKCWKFVKFFWHKIGKN